MASKVCRKGIAQETVEITEKHKGYCTYKGTNVKLDRFLETCCKDTVLYTPKDLKKLVKRAGQSFYSQGNTNTMLGFSKTVFRVENIHTLKACRGLIDHAWGVQRVACLNFASGTSRCGGFLNGANAQEESLALCSGLYSCLLSPDVAKYYIENNKFKTGLYTNHLIYSHAVPVFRDEDTYSLLEEPYCVDIITCPAPNSRIATKNDHTVAEIESALKFRMDAILAVALENGVNAIVLGAFGCGAFSNSPGFVAKQWYDLLMADAGKYKNRFNYVTFAVLDHSVLKINFKTFESVLNSE